MGVYRDPGHTKGVTEHDIRRLAPDAREGYQVGQPAGHLAAEAIAQRLAESDDAIGFGPEEAGGLDDLLHLGPVRRRVVRRRTELGKQRPA